MRTATTILRFTAVLFIMTTACSLIWAAFVTDHLYSCTDPGVWDFVRPADWVHGEVNFVPDVYGSRKMGEPDVIKTGWSLGKLYSLWGTLWALSVAVSLYSALGEKRS